MAQIVVGIGTSHSPLLSIASSRWPEWAERDVARTDLAEESGTPRTYGELLARAPAELAAELTAHALAKKEERCKSALEELRTIVSNANLDAMIVIGDDQSEHLHSDNLPAVLVYHGATIRNTRAEFPQEATQTDRERILGYFEPERDVDYPVAQPLAEYIIGSLLDRHFDIAASNALPKPRAEGHAHQFPHRRLLGERLPVVPVLLNTYVPPTQPRAARCYDLGVAIAEGIEAYGDDSARIGVLASGGLSHFVVWEQFDRALLAALERGDRAHLKSLPETHLQSGTSEVKCWVTAAGACRGLAFQTVDYVPGYRSPAGTGVGLAFGVWR